MTLETKYPYSNCLESTLYDRIFNYVKFLYTLICTQTDLLPLSNLPLCTWFIHASARGLRSRARAFAGLNVDPGSRRDSLSTDHWACLHATSTRHAAIRPISDVPPNKEINKRCIKLHELEKHRVISRPE